MATDKIDEQQSNIVSENSIDPDGALEQDRIDRSFAEVPRVGVKLGIRTTQTTAVVMLVADLTTDGWTIVSAAANPYTWEITSPAAIPYTDVGVRTMTVATLMATARTSGTLFSQGFGTSGMIC